MKKNNKIEIPHIKLSFKLIVLDTKLKENTVENNNADIKELERFLALMKHTQINGTFELKMICNDKNLFEIQYKVNNGILEGFEIWFIKSK